MAAAYLEDDHSGVPQKPLVRHRVAARYSTVRAALGAPRIPFVAAKRFSTGGNNPASRVVIHTAECPVKRGMARAVANYFADGSGGRAASAHYCVDPAEVIQCVNEADVAYHAPPNSHSIGIEPAGTASGTDWTTVDAKAELGRVADLTADICRRYDLPAVFLAAADLRAGKHGITTHHQVTLAWHQSTHTDPDPTLPVAQLVAMVAARLGAPPAPMPAPEEEEVPKKIVMIGPGMDGYDGRHWLTDGISASPIATPDDEKWLVDWCGAQLGPDGNPLLIRPSQLEAFIRSAAK